MARRSLKPQLNQIRAWVRQGRTDAWIAHQLDISASELREFRKQHDLNPDEEGAGSADLDLRDEIEAEVEAATAEEAEVDETDEKEEDEGEDGEDEGEEPDAEEKPEKPAKPARPRRAKKDSKPEGDEEKSTGEKKPGGRRRRRRGRRGGRGRRKEIEATFDHGERDGYGLWFDPSVKDNPVYAERWAGKREVTVRIEADQIVIRRAGEPAGTGGSDDSDE